MTSECQISRRNMLAMALGSSVVMLPGARNVLAGTDENAVANMELNARPSPITIDPKKTAVIVVDMQNDFGSDGGMFQRAGIDISMIKAAVPPTARVLAAARENGIKVIYLKMGFNADLSDAGEKDSVNRVRHLNLKVGKKVKDPTGADSQILVKNTWNTEIVRELIPKSGDTVLYKSRFSGFYKTELDDILRQNSIKYLIFTGCTTSICVESTIRDAMFRDYLPILLADCSGEPIGNGLPRSNHDASLLNIEVLLGWVSSSKDFLSAIKKS